MSAVSRSLRSASKQLRIQSRVAAPIVGSATVGAGRFAQPTTTTTTTTAATPSSRSSFSTTVSRKSGAPTMASASREYDPEIKDIADYVANKAIDSELAVS